MKNTIAISEDKLEESGKGGKIVYLFPSDYEGTSTRHYTHFRTPTRNDRLKSIKRDFTGSSITYESRTSADNELLNFAYHSIVNSRDQEFDRIERSNFFDEWKDTLNTIIIKIKNLSANHRKILGALVVATRSKDISDFNDEGLKLFESATFTLKQFRVNKKDSKRIIQGLLEMKMEIIIPLGFENNEDTNDTIDNEIKKLIKRFEK